MVSIGLICEGVSEVNVVSYIIRRYLGDVDVNTIQPKIVNSKQDTFGGWLQVLDYCNDEEFKKIFATNDYIVVQIDTDTCNLLRMLKKQKDISDISQYNYGFKKFIEQLDKVNI